MIPVVREGRAVAAFALGDFVFVVREEQIHAAGVEVDGVAKERLAHRTTLDVPAGAAGTRAARAGPFHVAVFLGLVGFPERKVGHGVFVVGVGDDGGDLELALFNARQGSVAWERIEFEVDGAVGGAVGVTFFH